MSEEGQQYFVSIEVKWGKQKGDKQEAESTGGQNWGYLTYDQSVAVQNVAVIPGVVAMIEAAGDMGLDIIENVEMADMIRSKKAK